MKITANPSSPILDFAADELGHFLAEVEGVDDWRFNLSIDIAMPPYTFAVHSRDQVVTCSGADAAGVLHAIYTMLEQVGWCFEITGPRCLPSVNLENLIGWSAHVKPSVNQRGIRQHINFPMDISGYPLAEALEYIRNLARMCFNHVTFHSYHGQWYEVPLDDHTELAGHFFYGDRYQIPNHPVIQAVVRNQKTFCIPEIEPVYDQPEERSRQAVAWLQAVILEAKRVGLQVQFSFELREQDTGVSLATVDSILKTYPQIDVLEMITQETGGWGQAVSADELRATAVRWFGADVLHDPEIAPYLVDGQVDLHQLIRELGHYVELCHVLKARGGHMPKLSVGIYCVVPQYHKVLLAIMRKFVPAEVGFTFLLNHGNRAVAQNARDLALTPADWQRSMVYSWIEFDGTMYLQQNALTGIHQLIELGRETNGNHPINGISLNHWRTAENRTCIRYAALALLHGTTTEDFYRGYAASLGLEKAPSKYAVAMQLIDETDTRARDELPNVGFCYAGVWGQTGLGYYGKWEAKKLRAVRRQYENARLMLRHCKPDSTNSAGRAYLDFLMNRVDCTVIYLRAIEKAVELQPICSGKSPDDLTDAEQAAVAQICDEALRLMDEYIALHAAFLPDRGCEGTLVSFYHVPPAVLKRIQAEYTASKLPGESNVRQPGIDAPPAPIDFDGASHESTGNA